MIRAAIVIAMCTACTHAALDSVRITVQSGPQQIFGGLGANAYYEFDSQVYDDGTWSGYPLIPTWIRDTLTQFVWNDCHLTCLRYQIPIDSKNKNMIDGMKDNLERKLRYLPNLKVNLTWSGMMTNPEHWGAQQASHIDTLERVISADLGRPFKVDYTELCNEPNQGQFNYQYSASIPVEQLPAVIKAVRKHLDADSLQHVKIMAPGPSNVDQYMFDAIDAIQGDPEALADLDAWEYHSYNMSITQEVSDLLAPTGKEIWQTESSLPEGDNGATETDSMTAAQSMTRFLADMNFGVKYWEFFLDYGRSGTPPNSPAGMLLVDYNQLTGEFRPTLKFYYFRQLSRTFVEGTAVRKCITNFDESNGHSDADHFMFYTYGKKLPIAASAGIQPDGSWAMAVINHTGLRFTDYGTEYYPKADYTVTFHVEELAGSGDKKLTVWRCNASEVNKVEPEPLTMHNGDVTVTVHHCELVCLGEHFDTTFMAVPDFNATSEGGSCGTCGTGIILAFIPPVGFRVSSFVRRRRRGQAKSGSR